MNLMTILVKRDSISSKIKTVYYVVPASVRAIFIQDFARGEISYKVKKATREGCLCDLISAFYCACYHSLNDLFTKYKVKDHNR